MKRVLSFFLFATACIVICSCKSKSSQVQPTVTEETFSDIPSAIQAFYKAYCTKWDGQAKTDSILSRFCTEELKNVVMKAVQEHDFVLDGHAHSAIDTESISVAQKNEKYVVSYQYSNANNERRKDSLYIMVNKKDSISYIIRPRDNYRIPNASFSKSLYTFNDYEYVDLGLSVNWALWNIGSYWFSPLYHGDFFAWGETATKYDFSKDNRFAARQKIYFDDGKTVLEPDDDAATALWGKDWRMPTKEEFQELLDKCQWEWMKQGNPCSYKITGPNGNTIFLPAGGMKMDTRQLNSDDGLYYWTSTCQAKGPVRSPKAWMFYSVSDGADSSISRRMEVALTPLDVQVGRLIRPVTSKPYIPIRDISINKKDLKLEIGEDFILTASFIPQDATRKNLYWHSGNPAVAHIDRNGKVTAVSAGKCTITAVCGELKKECQVTVVMPHGYVPIKSKEYTIFEFGKNVDSSFVDGLNDFDETEELIEMFHTHMGHEDGGFDVTIWNFADGDWEGEPGEFCMVTIETAGGQYQIRNYDWVTDNRFENGYFYCYPVSSTEYLLFFKGFDYGCCPGLLTILAVDDTGARTVFNKEYGLEEINIDPFSMTLESSYGEVVSEYERYYPTAYNLFIEDGVLKMKHVSLLRE